MHDAFKKMLDKKGKKEIPEHEKAAKLSMLQALKDEMKGMMAGDLKGHKAKKVEVASDSDEGLKAGLDHAKNMLDADHGGQDNSLSGEGDESYDDEQNESPEHEALESPDEEDHEMEQHDELDHHVQKYKEDPSEENHKALMDHLEQKKHNQHLGKDF